MLQPILGSMLCIKVGPLDPAKWQWSQWALPQAVRHTTNHYSAIIVIWQQLITMNPDFGYGSTAVLYETPTMADIRRQQGSYKTLWIFLTVIFVLMLIGGLIGLAVWLGTRQWGVSLMVQKKIVWSTPKLWQCLYPITFPVSSSALSQAVPSLSLSPLLIDEFCHEPTIVLSNSNKVQ